MADRTRYVNTASSGGDGTTNGESGGTAAFASLSAAEAAIQTEDSDLANGKVTIYCGVGSGSAADTTAVTVAGFTNASSSNYIQIEANPSDTGGDQRAVMPWSTSIYRLDVTSAGDVFALTVQTNYTRTVSLQVRGTTTVQSGTSYGLRDNATGDNLLVDSCLLVGRYNNASDAINGNTFGAQFTQNNNVMRNSVCISENVGAGRGYGVNGLNLSTSTATAYNVTAVSAAAENVAVAFRAAGAATVINCLGVFDSSGPAGTEAAFTNSSSWNASTDYNASADATAPGGNSRTSQTFTFVNAAGGNYHLDDQDAGAKGYGDDLSGTFTDAFEGDPRDLQVHSAWDIGASQSEIVRYVNTASSGGNGRTNDESGTLAAYASLSAAEAAEQADLTSVKRLKYIVCGVGSGSAADTTAVTVAGWTTSSTYYPTIQAYNDATNGDQRAVMPYSTSIYRLEVSFSAASSSQCLLISQNYTRLISIQAKATRTANASGQRFDYAVGVNGTNCLIDSCHLVGHVINASNMDDGANPLYFAAGANTARNCVLNQTHSGTATSECIGFVDYSGTTTCVLQNCTSVCNRNANTLAACYISQGSGTQTTYTNCLSDLTGTTGSSESGEFLTRLSGAFNAASDYNASADDTTSPGSNSRDSQTFTFVDESGSDYHLTSGDAGARNYGTDLSGSFTVDFDGNTRPNTGGSWDIGAHEEQTSDAAGVVGAAYYLQYYRSVVT